MAILIPLPAHVERVEKDPALGPRLLAYARSIDAPVRYVWPGMPAAHVRNAYRASDGVMLIGGDDIHPETYRRAPHPRTHPEVEGRDALELRIATWCFADRTPVLGICRGCQLIAVAAGGTLHQHIPDLTDESHGPGVSTAATTVFPYHAVHIDAGSRAYGALGTTMLDVLSSHHQAIDDPGRLRVSGRSPAGIVEVVESRDPAHWCFGIQGHPERMRSDAWDVFFRDLRAFSRDEKAA